MLKLHVWEKQVLGLWSKILETNQNVEFIKLQTSWGMNLDFCMWLYIHKNNKFIQSFQVGVVRHACSCPKLCQIVSQLHLKNRLSFKVGFFHVVSKLKISSIIFSVCSQTCPKWLNISYLYLRSELRYEFDCFPCC